MRIANNVRNNLDKIEKFAVRAARAKANIMILPETCITGELEIDRKDGGTRFRNFFIRLAKKNKIDIVTGSIMEIRNRRSQNVAYYVDSMGRVLARYAKRNLWLGERRESTPGTKPVVANTRYGKIGLLICWDLSKPQLMKDVVDMGAQIVACPSYWWKDIMKGVGGEFMDSLITTRTFENGVIVAYCNAAGRGDSGELIGRSQISVPYTLRKKVLAHNKEGLLIADVDTSLTKKAQSAFKLRD